jgi:hypothetical protein
LISRCMMFLECMYSSASQMLRKNPLIIRLSLRPFYRM